MLAGVAPFLQCGRAQAGCAGEQFQVFDEFNGLFANFHHIARRRAEHSGKAEHIGVYAAEVDFAQRVREVYTKLARKVAEGAAGCSCRLSRLAQSAAHVIEAVHAVIEAVRESAQAGLCFVELPLKVFEFRIGVVYGLLPFQRFCVVLAV